MTQTSDKKELAEVVEETTTPAKKTVAKKAATKKPVEKEDNGQIIIVFESGTAYVSGEYRFTKESRIQEIPAEDARIFLELDNFRLADQLEIEDFLASREG